MKYRLKKITDDLGTHYKAQYSRLGIIWTSCYYDLLFIPTSLIYSTEKEAWEAIERFKNTPKRKVKYIYESK